MKTYLKLMFAFLICFASAPLYAAYTQFGGVEYDGNIGKNAGTTEGRYIYTDSQWDENTQLKFVCKINFMDSDKNKGLTATVLINRDNTTDGNNCTQAKAAATGDITTSNPEVTIINVKPCLFAKGYGFYLKISLNKNADYEYYTYCKFYYDNGNLSIKKHNKSRRRR